MMLPNDSAVPDLLSGLVPTPSAAQCPKVLQQEEEEHAPRVPLPSFEVGLPCAGCNRKILFVVLATTPGLRGFQRLILSDHLNFLCVHCIRSTGILNHRRRDGRQQ
ncbi:putative E7 oncogenic protein [Eptesicus serotinus papillomavirus 1]|uniref:Putative E7 oncogenic protein n=1 Tax=Eptesicus serotinus papillomavirus 1 TaxID=1464071 RepID=W8EC52_9PAPI|nr:putative E7 oncogenic protein [Eptesicus serotinus papillomavirus 1]AHJ81385.1 putative E7 oncogenic protein [Eptesicus serotinus papillomavirus 1]